MAATKMSTEGVFQAVLLNYLVSQARTVEGTVNRALEALLGRDERLASEVFLTEPRINEMEIVIDEHAIRLLRQGNLSDADVRLIVATLKINNDLERMGDLAVNVAERAISLSCMGDVETPARTGAYDRRGPRHGLEMSRRADLSECRSGDAGPRKRRRRGSISRPRLRSAALRYRRKFLDRRAQSAVRPGVAAPGTHRRSRHEHRRRRLVLGAGAGGSPRPGAATRSSRRECQPLRVCSHTLFTPESSRDSIT